MSEQTKEQRLVMMAREAQARWVTASGDDVRRWMTAIVPLVNTSDDLELKVASDSKLIAELIERGEARKSEATDHRLQIGKLQDERATLAAEVKRLTETVENIGRPLKVRCEEVALLKREIASQQAAYEDLLKRATGHEQRADRLAAGVDALVERYSDLQRGAR